MCECLNSVSLFYVRVCIVIAVLPIAHTVGIYCAKNILLYSGVLF